VNDPNTLLTALGAALVTLILCPVVGRLARVLGFVSRPSGDRWHPLSIPLLGGIAIAAGVTAATLVQGDGGWVTLALVGSASAALVVGLIDDRISLSPTAKLVASLVLGAIVVYVLNQGRPVSALVVIASVVWFAGVVHAVNIVDNMDGLAAGIGAIAAFALGTILLRGTDPAAGTVLYALAGSLLGFLAWNSHPARLFMGDGGSLYIGALLAGGSLVALFRTTSGISQPLGAGVALAFFVGEAVFVSAVRSMAGRKPTRGGVDHTSHRLVALGFSVRRSVLILYAVALASATVSIWLARSGGAALPGLAALVVGLTLGGVYLAHVPTYQGDDFTGLERVPFSAVIQSAMDRSHAPQVLLDLLLVTACYYTAYRLRFDGESLDIFFPSFTASLPIVLVCKLVAHYGSGLYRRSWLTFGLSDLLATVRAIVAGTTAVVLAATYLYRFERFSRGVFIIDAVLLLIAVTASRLSFRLIAHAAVLQSTRAARVLICGAGERGQLLAREMLANTAWRLKPVGFIDGVEPNTGSIMGVRIVGPIDGLNEAIERLRVDEVIFSGDPLEEAQRDEALRICAARGIAARELVFELRQPRADLTHSIGA
jgi:UDP-GlcNAc:undecaprenyl-phosphate GlcNAc-1-phosphate transferase